MFGNDVALAGMLGMRRAVLHTWDVAVALDPATEIAAEVVVLLIYTVSGTAGRVGKSAQNTHEIVVKTVAPERSLVLMTGPEVTVVPGPGTTPVELRILRDGRTGRRQAPMPMQRLGRQLTEGLWHGSGALF
jgi:hypothetical protein